MHGLGTTLLVTESCHFCMSQQLTASAGNILPVASNFQLVQTGREAGTCS